MTYLLEKNMFKEILDEICNDTLIQNILNLKYIVDDNIKSITIVLWEGFWPLKFSEDKCFQVKNENVLENYIL
jgi:hypothetical protein